MTKKKKPTYSKFFIKRDSKGRFAKKKGRKQKSMVCIENR